MFTKRNSFLVLLILLSGNLAFSQTKSIRSLKLNFQRTETSSENESAVMSGFIFYQANPFIFSFNTTYPVEQITYINTDGAFFINEGTLYEYSQGEELLYQTCVDFLTWFKSDLGLSEQGYSIIECKNEDQMIKSTWIYKKAGLHPYDKIEVFSDPRGRFSRLLMYAKDDELFAQTTLSDFTLLDGIYYPGKILTQSYQNGQIYITTELIFTNVEVNFTTGTDLIVLEQSGNNIEVKSAPIQKENPVVFEKAQKPAGKTYTISSAAIATNLGFKFYKKFVTSQDNSNCPFTPTCSQYMKECIQKYGVFGVIKGLERLKRCTNDEHSRNLYPTDANSKHVDLVN